MIKINKIIQTFLLIILFSSFTFGVKIVNDEQVNKSTPAVNEGLQSFIITVFSFGIMALLFLVFIFIFAWILMKIWKKLTEVKRGKVDFLYNYFLTLLNQCHLNYDKKLKKRNWKFLWIFWKRKPVFMENSNGELDIIGTYHGESFKKEGFYALAIYNKIGLFKYSSQIILIPNEIKNTILKKIDVEQGRTIILKGEGLDSINSYDYFFMPLIIDEENDSKFLNFANKIRKEFVEPIVYNDVIDESFLSYRKGIIGSVEFNPFVQFGRRGGENFKK